MYAGSDHNLTGAIGKVNKVVATQQGLDAALHGPVKGCALTASGGGPFPDLRLDIVNAAGQVGCSSGKDPQVFAPNVHAGSSWLRAGPAASSLDLRPARRRRFGRGTSQRRAVRDRTATRIDISHAEYGADRSGEAGPRRSDPRFANEP